MEKKRGRWIANKDRIEYDGELVTPSTELTAVKCRINKVISTMGARYAAMDIKYAYLGKPLVEYEYTRIPLQKILEEIRKQYKLAYIVKYDHMMIEIQGMYGLP